MITILFHVVFLFFSLFVLVQSISYSFYEYKTEKNHYGSIVFTIFTLFCVIFSNYIIIGNN